MARPFPNTFDKDSMSPGGNTPISYKADVNRQKTKKWANAPAVDYGGDDWGDEDEYDLPPPPIPKVTGLRQQGQALPNANAHPQRTEPPIVDNGKKTYGELPPLPGASNPSNPRGRSNSFEADEERNFSNTTARQPSPSTTAAPSGGSGPATRFSQIAGVQAARGPSGPPPLSISTQQPAATGLRKASKVVSPVAEVETPPDVQPPGRQNTGESAPSLPSSSVYSQTPTSDTRTPSSDYHGRRDFSPSAVVPPLSTRASPAPQANETAPAGRFPGRKSSLSQLKGPDVAAITQRSQESITPKPWSAGRSASPGPTAKSPTSPAKALPFIRPADIYRRAEEERQSMESGRPSMDSIMGARNADRSDSPAKPQLRGRSSSESLGGASRRRTSFEGDDASDSGRRLMPMLEPVRERKSEYGFEGFNVSDQGPHQESHEPSDSAKLDVEEARRHSVSPKLPDLNRISGFGMDMFSQSNSEDSEVPALKENETTPRNSTAAAVASPPEEEPTLRNQPSFGFRSVVNQAFDRTDDSSVPATPASRSGSGVRRTDSESTGTTGISPIMSRVPSSAAPDNGNRDFSTPSIPEVINEQAATEPTVHQPQPIAGFKPGHRRDISTPSPGNSPARTPDVAKSNAPTQGHEAIISDPRPSSEAASEPLQPPRPIHEREASFRPALPGGWTSYTTTERSNTPSQDGQMMSDDALQTPLKETPSGPIRTGSDYDLTPTTTKHSLPASALGAAVVGAAVMGEQHREASPAGTPRSESPRVNLGRDALPTPDPTMAPSGNVYSTSALDPRLANLPPLEQAPKETQLRPDTVHRPISESPDGPPPPPKDTPRPEATDNSGYFQPTSPLKQKAPAENAVEQHLEPSSRPQVDPSLSSDAGPDDEVNDKLRQEIVRSLTPRLSDSGRKDSDQFDDSASYGAGRESTYLPREYDNYWASTNPEQEPVPAIASPSAKGPSSFSGAPTLDSGHVEPEIQPLNPRKTDRQSVQPERPTIQQRFSWEQSNESVPLEASGETNANTGANPDVASAGPTEPAAIQQEPLMSDPVITAAPPNTSVKSESRPSSAHPGADAALLAEGAVAATGAAAVYAHNSLEPKSRRLSLAEEKDPQVASYAISPTRPEDEHPSRLPQAYAPLATDQNASAPSTVSPVAVNSPMNKQMPQTGNLMKFSQIMAIKSTQQRIQTYDEHRAQFAAMESGLTNWISTLKSQQPEHADATGSWGGSGYNVPSGSARAKFGKPSGPGAPPVQQPYYQQYLNASSPNAPATPVSRPGQGIPANASQQGFSPGGAKITSQQVQAKGKEFLHTAGVFGGKAGKAGKGLLAKGKSRLRGAGGDKTSPPAKPKNERRTSWGFPLGVSRSSGRQDASIHDSQQNIPMQIGAGSRSNTMPLHRASSPPQFAPPARASMDGTLTGARYTVNPPISRDGDPFTSREIRSEAQADAEEAGRDHFGAPAPVVKHQPSWDPINATPIAEEDAFHYGQRPDHSIPANSATLQDHLTPPAPRSERNSNEISFYDASEEQPDEPDEPTEDWVMVSPEEPKDLPFQDERKNLPPQKGTEDLPANSEPASALMPTSEQAPASEPPHDPETMPTQTVDTPGPSVLNRPRGSTVDEPSPPLPASLPKVSPPSGTGREPTDFQSTPPAPRAEPQGQNSSFLPPIRRTSTFGLGFGSRQKRPRFPIDDDGDEDFSGDVSPQESFESNGAEVSGPAEGIITGGRGAAHAMGMPRPDSEAWPVAVRKEMMRQEEVPPVPTISLPLVSRQSQEGLHQQTPIMQPEPMRPNSMHRGSVDYGQRSIQHTPQENIGHPAAYMPTEYTNPRKSEEAWRPNANAAAPPSHGSTQWVEPTGNPSRNSWEPQRNRGMSGSSQNFTRPSGNYVERPPLAGPIQLKSFDQPPSSAQRYPDLFRPEQPLPSAPGTYGDRALAESHESRDLPAHYYQQPIPREAAFLPRQQTNEYQLPGVGPPAEEPSPGRSRRNSGFFRELGGRMSRGSSRERGGSISRDDGFSNPVRPFDSRGNEYAESSVTSEESKEQKKKRTGFFGKGNLSRASTGGMGPPQSRESMVAHNPGSRVDLFASEQSSPVHDKKRSFFGTNLTEPKSKLNKPERASTSSAVEEPGKKKRFSGLTGFFGKPAAGSSPSRASLPAQSREQPQAVRQTSYNERQPIESPSFNQHKGAPSAQKSQLQPDHSYPPSNYRPPTSPNYPPRANNYQPLTTDHYQPRSPNHPPPATGVRAPSQSRNLLSKLTTPNSSSSPDSRKEKSKSRRPSAAGLLNGFMGRKSQQSDRDRDESRSQGSQSQTSRQALPPARTYTDLQEEHLREQPIEPPKQQRVEEPVTHPKPQKHIPWQDPSFKAQERGRRVSREPQYDSVPIPGGYSLVRGQGASTVPTEYDPRGLNRAQQADPRLGPPDHSQTWGPSQNSSPQGQVQPQQYFNGPQHQSPPPQSYPSPPIQQYHSPVSQQSVSSPIHGQERHKPPSLGALETYESYNRSASRRLSREDLLARSPARLPEGQQPPYQLSLPGDAADDEEDKPLPIEKDPIIITSTPSPNPNSKDPIKRLQQPVLQHPGSPAGYPVPESTFSPVNPSANDIPPPPPPKWPNHLDAQYRPGHQHSLSANDSLNLSMMDLDRSNTRRTAVSAVSNMSSPAQPDIGLGRTDSLTVPHNLGAKESPSPSPPTPEERENVERGRRDERGTSREKRISTSGASTAVGEPLKTTVLEHQRPAAEDDLYDASPRLPKTVDPPTPIFNSNGNASHPVSPTTRNSAGPSKLNPAHAQIGKENENENAAELDNTDQERYREAREEKIFYDGGVQDEGEVQPSMSATSYPGQEWNPYAGVGFEDGYE